MNKFKCTVFRSYYYFNKIPNQRRQFKIQLRWLKFYKIIELPSFSPQHFINKKIKMLLIK